MSEFNPELLPFLGQDVWVKVIIPYEDFRGKRYTSTEYLNIGEVGRDNNTIYVGNISDKCVELLLSGAPLEQPEHDDIFEGLNLRVAATINDLDEYTIYQPAELYTTDELLGLLDNCDIIADPDDDEDYFL